MSRKIEKYLDNTSEGDVNLMMSLEIYTLYSVRICSTLEALLPEDVKSNKNVITNI